MRKIGKLVALLLGGTSLMCAGSCARSEETGFTADPSKTQIYIGIYDGGYGQEWVKTIAKKFEEENAETVFEDGKKGIQVQPSVSKVYALDQVTYRLSDQIDDICFIEQANYYNLINANAIKDITEWVTTPLTEYGENESIQDKMDKTDKNYYGQDEVRPQYYGLPWYFSMMTINYDVQLFEDNNFYFAAPGEKCDKDGFVLNKDTKRSAGPDNEFDTIDDGQPATYDDFFKLCDKIVETGMVPMIWAGGVQNYVNYMLATLAADVEGFDNMSLNYTYDGNAVNSLVTKIENGIAQCEESLAITAHNGYELRRQKGLYYGLQFLHRLITTKGADGNPKYYTYNDCFSNSMSHKSAQSKFLRSNYTTSIDSIAMMIDGTWWYNEASATFNSMASQSGASKQDRKIGIMSMPKTDASQLGNETTLMQAWSTCCVVRKGSDESKNKAVRAFYRYLHTDESLSAFATDACGVRPFSFDLTASAKLPLYVKQQFELYQKCRTVKPYANNPICKSYLSEIHANVNTIVDGVSYNLITTAFNEGVSAEKYFNGLATYTNENSWKKYVTGIQG